MSDWLREFIIYPIDLYIKDCIHFINKWYVWII